MKGKSKPVDWRLIESLCLRSFTGNLLSVEERGALEDAYRQFPEEYVRRTAAVRDEERARLKML